MAEKRGTETRSERSQGQSGLERFRDRGRFLSRRHDPFDPFAVGPFALIRRMQDDMDRMFGSFGIGGAWPSLSGEEQRADWSPAIDVFQRGNELVVRADVPGLSREDLSVEIGEDALTICGERRYDREEEHEGVFRSERGHGRFCRVVPLPEGAVTDNAKANFKDGVLEVSVPTPPQEVRRGRRIEIGQESATKSEQKK
jgi:HSP20 family protein